MRVERPDAGTPVSVSLITPDLDTAQQFYGRLLGWQFGSRVDGATVALHAGTPVATLLTTDAAPVTGWVLTLQAPPDVADRIRATGGRVLGARGTLTYAADPAGASFATGEVEPGPATGPSEAAEPGAPHAGAGRPVWYENMTTDPAGADGFYQDVFGLITMPPGGPADPVDPVDPGDPADPGDPGEAGPDYVLLLAGGRPVAGRLGLPPDLAAALGARWMIYFADLDVDAAADRAVQLGGVLAVPPRDAPTGRVAAVIDPAGAIFTLIRPA